MHCHLTENMLKYILVTVKIIGKKIRFQIRWHTTHFVTYKHIRNTGLTPQDKTSRLTARCHLPHWYVLLVGHVTQHTEDDKSSKQTGQCIAQSNQPGIPTTGQSMFTLTTGQASSHWPLVKPINLRQRGKLKVQLFVMFNSGSHRPKRTG